MVSYKGRNIDPRQVGQELNVRAVVTGRVRRRGDTISIQAELIDLDNVSQIWGQHYDRRLADMLLVQEEISRDIFENLRMKIERRRAKTIGGLPALLKGPQRLEQAHPGRVAARHRLLSTGNHYGSYLRGSLCRAGGLLQHAGDLRGPPTEATDFPRLGRRRSKPSKWMILSPRPTRSLAFIKFRWEGDRVEAEREFRLAIQYKPTYAPAHQWYSSYLVALERFDEAIAEAKRTAELEPLSFTAKFAPRMDSLLVGPKR